MGFSNDTNEGWSSLLARLGGVDSNYRQQLQWGNEEAAAEELVGVEYLLAGFDEALAAVTILRGPDDARPFVPPMGRVIEHLGRLMTVGGMVLNNASLLNLLVVGSISATIGAPLPMPELDLEAIFTELMTGRQFDTAEHVQIGLLALELGRFPEVRGLFGKIDPAKAKRPPTGDPVDMVKAITIALKSESGKLVLGPAWDAFLRRFPALIAAKKVQWPALLLAGRLVLSKLGGLPLDQVADAVHRRVLELAAEPSP